MLFSCRSRRSEEIRSKAPTTAAESLTVGWRFFGRVFALEHLLGGLIFKAKPVCSCLYSEKEPGRHKHFSQGLPKRRCVPGSRVPCGSGRQPATWQPPTPREPRLSCRAAHAPRASHAPLRTLASFSRGTLLGK